MLLGGLDTLELIGRKTMDVLQDGDPGLRKKRAFLSNKKPNLSAVCNIIFLINYIIENTVSSILAVFYIEYYGFMQVCFF